MLEEAEAVEYRDAIALQHLEHARSYIESAIIRLNDSKQSLYQLMEGEREGATAAQDQSRNTDWLDQINQSMVGMAKRSHKIED